jgi:hypothetical protein
VNTKRQTRRSRLERLIQAVSVSALISLEVLGPRHFDAESDSPAIEREIQSQALPVHPLERLDNGTVISLPYFAEPALQPRSRIEAITLN